MYSVDIYNRVRRACLMPAQPEWSGVLGSRWLAFQFGGFGLGTVLQRILVSVGSAALNSRSRLEIRTFGSG